MAEPTQGKRQLRTMLRQQRRALAHDQQIRASQSATHFAQTLPQWGSATHIALYRDGDGEMGTGHLSKACIEQGKIRYLPVISAGNTLEFALWDQSEPLQDNRFGIAEPPPGAKRRGAGDLDIVFMPLVGWDRAGNRLGMGGGYYDRTLQSVSGPLLVGLAHSLQEIKGLPYESWDIRLDAVLTESGIHWCSSGSIHPPEQPISG